ncbi:MAG: hypothetical protein KDA85_05580 [Planctomycetaceae bacterium]|nr:hypothetical protein [Planctomycetaceae bacterium]
MEDASSRTPDGPRQAVARGIMKGIDELIRDARDAVRPLEVDPYRGRLFELFVTADGAGLIPDDSTVSSNHGLDDEPDECDLSADGLCRNLASQWGLDMAARESAVAQTRLPKDQLEQMRLLWSVMRMWMEWSYAWRRWSEFHDADAELSQ